MPRIREVKNEVVTSQGSGGPQEECQPPKEGEGKQKLTPGRLQGFGQGEQTFIPSGYLWWCANVHVPFYSNQR